MSNRPIPDSDPRPERTLALRRARMRPANAAKVRVFRDDAEPSITPGRTTPAISSRLSRATLTRRRAAMEYPEWAPLQRREVEARDPLSRPCYPPRPLPNEVMPTGVRLETLSPSQRARLRRPVAAEDRQGVLRAIVYTRSGIWAE